MAPSIKDSPVTRIMQAPTPQDQPGQDDSMAYPIIDIAIAIGMPETTSDLQYLRANRENVVPGPERSHAEQLVKRQEFREWLQSPASSKLLVHGAYGVEDHVSGLSLVCLSLFDRLLACGHRFFPLVFFCGMHKDGDIGARTGGRAMLRSFIYQLLADMCLFGASVVGISPRMLDSVRDGDMEALSWLFSHLVCRQRPRTTVCCLVDGAVFYESEEIWDTMDHVLKPLLKVSGETHPTRAEFKLLVTSPTPTSYFQESFPDDLVLSMAEWGGVDIEPSSESLEEELTLGIQHALQNRVQREQIASLFGPGGR